MLDFFPNADHAALYSAIANGDFRAGGLDVKPQTPAEPVRTAEAAGRRQGRHGDLLRARAAARARRGPQARLDRGARAAAADLDHRAAAEHVKTVADLAGKTRRHRRHPLPGRRAAHRRAGRRRRTRRASRKSTSASTSCRRCSRARSRRRSAASGTTRRSSCSCCTSIRSMIPVDQAGVPTYDELVLVVREEEAKQRRRGTARVPAGADARRARGAREPERGRGARREGEPVARTEAAARIDQADAAGGRAERSRQALRLAEPEGVGGVRATGCSRTSCSRTIRTPACRRSPTSSCRGRASRSRCASAC